MIVFIICIDNIYNICSIILIFCSWCNRIGSVYVYECIIYVWICMYKFLCDWLNYRFLFWFLRVFYRGE